MDTAPRRGRRRRTIVDDIGHGTVLARRYTLTDLLSDHGGARFWRAQDEVLSRDVAVHVIPLEDTRADAMLDAARLASGVLDPRLLRVLDADVASDGEDSYAYVVHEWGEGRSVDLMLQEGPLSPRRAAWLVKEVAECLAACHVQGIAHGRLLPENVLINESGGVKLIGLLVDASLQPGLTTWEGSEQPLQEHEADMVNLASLLYACLTGRWPGTDGSDVPEAPMEGRRALRPRRVRAGIPRALDRICARVVSDPAPSGVVTDVTAHEVAASLAAYVGDPAPNEPRLLTDPVEREARRWDPARDTRRAAAAEDTAVGAPVFFDDDTAVGWSEGAGGAGGSSHDEPTTRVRSPATSRTPLEGVRPLFVDDDPRPGHPTEHPRRHAAEESRARRLEDSQPSSTSGSLWPLLDTGGGGEETAAADSGRGWMRLAAALTALVVVGVAVVLAFNLGQRSSLGQLVPDDSGDAGASAEATAGSEASDGEQGGAAAGPWPIRGAVDFDPQGSDGENPEVVPDAFDGDPGTAWRTLRYNNRPDLGGLKDGVGIVLDLGRQREVGSVRLQLLGEPTSLEVLAAPGRGSSPTTREDFSVVGSAQDAGTSVDVDVESGTTTRYVGIWLTSLPQVAPARYQARIAEVTVLP